MICDDDTTSGHNPNLILQKANEKVEQNDLDGAIMICQSALLDWVDDAREMSGDVESDTVAKIGWAIANLWIGYANLYRSAKKYKAATETYEAAVNCPVAGSMGKVWREYARFQEERGRRKSAQKIFLRALVGVEDEDAAVVGDEAEKDNLWNDFLSMMKKEKGDDSLTLEQLRTAVKTEHMSQMQTAAIGREKKKRSHEDLQNGSNDYVAKPMIVENYHGGSGFAAEGGVSNEADVAIKVKAAQKSSDELINLTENMPRSLTAEWHARDGNALASRPEPPLFSCSPPKLADPSFKDILGTELALKLIRLLMKNSDNDMTGNIILDIARGCWTMTALKEKESCLTLKALDEKLTKEYEKKESELDARLSAVKLSTTGDLLSAVEEVNTSEKSDFIAKCNQQRQQQLVNISWEFRHLFATQQQLLTAAGLPGFDGPTVDAASIHIQANICAFLHSHFFLRNRIGEEQHLTMLKSQESRISSLPAIPMPVLPVIAPPPPELPSIPPPSLPGFIPQNYTSARPPPFPPPFPPPQTLYVNGVPSNFVPPPPPNHVMPPSQNLPIHATIPNVGQPQYPPPPFR